MTKEMFNQPSSPFVTFYSFKGGVGRSMTLINVAGILAGRGFRVLVVDLDLEAPGLSFLVLDNSNPAMPQPGFIDLLADAVERGPEADLFSCSVNDIIEQYSCKYDIPEGILKRSAGELRIMPAGTLDEDYQSRLDNLNISGLYRDGVGKELILEFKRVIQKSGLYDYVFVDSRTGFSDESGICTRDLADHLMIVTGLNQQNITGITKFLTVLRQATEGQRKVQFILSPVPHGEDDLVDRRERMARDAFQLAWGQPVDLSLQIPYHPRLALTEEPHIFRRSKGYLYEAYTAVERALLSGLGLTAALLAKEAREAVLEGKYELALRKLQVAVKLDGGLQALDELSIILLRSNPADFTNLNFRQAPSLLGDNMAKELLTFLALELPSGSTFLRAWASSLHAQKSDLAGIFYQRIVDIEANDANTCGNYALFLQYVRRDYGQAEAFFKRALDIDSKHSNNLSNYAVFLQHIRHDYDQAEALFKRALAIEPQRAAHIASYALFLQYTRHDYDQAEDLFKRAIALEPNHGNSLGAYAVFLHQVRKDYEQAETFYKKALAEQPTHPFNIGAYAMFLHHVRQEHDQAEILYKRALAIDPNHIGNLNAYAVLLQTVRRDYDQAEELYKRAVAQDSNDARSLGNYASFLYSVRLAHERAGAMFEQALVADPNHANNLGNYALFLQNARLDYDEAEAMYKRAIAADSNNANNLGNYAIFLFLIRMEYDQCDALFKRALALDPKIANILSLYAVFLHNIRNKYDEAELLYKKALAVEPKDADSIGRYAVFLYSVRQNHDEADAMFKRAIAEDPKHANNLGNYALFLHSRRLEYNEADEMFKKALELKPDHADNLGNYAQFLFIMGRDIAASHFIERAFACRTKSQSLLTELHFYSYAHCWRERPQSLANLKSLLLTGARSPRWSLSPNAKRARLLGHPEPDLVAMLAEVVADERNIESLDQFPVWVSTEPV